MNVESYNEIIRILRKKKKKIKLEDGLSTYEINKIEDLYKIKFPKVLKEFYQMAMPVSHDFFNWRDFTPENIVKINDALNWPLEGTIFDVEENHFWRKAWGDKPEDMDEAVKVCCENMRNVPLLIPINGHRYIPYVEGMDNPPVLSVWQTDVIYYGNNLLEYFQLEFNVIAYEDIDFELVPEIPFWSQVIEVPDEEEEGLE